MLRPGRGGSNALPIAGGNGFGVGYGDMPSHVQYDADQKYGRRRSSSSKSSSVLTSLIKNPLFLLMLTCVVLFGSTLYYRGKEARVLKQLGVDSVEDALDRMETVHSDRDTWRKDAKRNIHDSKALEDKARQLENENRHLIHETEDLKRKLKDTTGGGGNEGHQKTVEHYAKRETAWRHQVQKLQNATARESKRAALERFGPGPHRVKFSLHLPNDDDDDHVQAETSKYFVAEMAPLELMPHAVHLFLEQVTHKLWDDTWFYLNGAHVLQAGPQAYEEEEPDAAEEAKLKEFERLQLTTLSFPEYNSNFPHVKWTIGFTGRPGGPDWYINKSDNTKTHGPGGQRQHTLLEQADPCFAKIVEGFDVLEQLFKLDVYDHGVEYANFFVEPVAIVEARILPPQGETKKKEEDAKKQGEQKPEEKKPEETKPEEKKHEEAKKGQHEKKEHEHHHKKPLVSHRVENDDDDILTEEDWHYEDEMEE